MLWMRVCGLDDLSSRVQQNRIGVWLGPEDPITFVEVIAERLRYLVGAAVPVILLSLLFTWGASLSEVAQVRVSGPDAVVLLGLQGNQGRGQT